jgi:hypothetical protein
MKREFLESFYSVTHDRQAKISKDKYHYIVELFRNDHRKTTELFIIDEECPEQAYIDAVNYSQNFID